MAVLWKPEASCARPRNIGVEPYLMAERVQFACEIEDVKPPSGRDRDFERAGQGSALGLDSLYGPRIRAAASRIETMRSR